MNIYRRTFARSLAIFPEAQALCVQDKSYSYRALEYWVNGCRFALRNMGLRPGDVVALLAKRSLIAYASILACAAEGFTWVPLNPDFPDARNRKMLSLSRAQVLVIDDENAESGARLVIDAPIQHILAQSALMANAHVLQPVVNSLPLLDVDATLPSYILFTSGTTGEPKGIPISQGNLDAYLQNFNALYSLPVRLRYSQMFDLTFDLSVHDLFVCWQRGGCLVVPTLQDILLPVQFVRRQQIQVWFSVPSIANIAKQSGLLRREALPSLQYTFFCGEALSVSSAEAWLQAAPESRVVNLYGPTETTIAITAFELMRNSGDWRQLSVVPIGWPYPGQHARVIRDDGAEASVGEAGELWLAGNQLGSGYLADITKTFAVFVAHRLPDCAETRWYRTGDCARAHPTFGLQYLGRMDRQVKINGYRVELLEVERSLREAAGTELVAVIPWPRCDAGLYTGMVGFVAQTALSEHQILVALRALLPGYMQPRQVVELAHLPTNNNGKVDYNALQYMISEEVTPA